MSEWQPIDTAQKTAVNVILKVPKGGHPGYREVIGHWAQNTSGEEQPSYSGWFYDTGYGFAQVKPEPTHWRPIVDERLSDPAAVFLNMMRGSIAKPEFSSLQRLYPEAKQLEAALRQCSVVLEMHRKTYPRTVDGDMLDALISAEAALRNAGVEV